MSRQVIPSPELRRGAIYLLHSRNLRLGVYDGERGFIGVREKFESRYLFTEVLNDPPGHGTAVALQQIGELPAGIEARELLPGDGIVRNAELFELLERMEAERRCESCDGRGITADRKLCSECDNGLRPEA